MTTKEGPFLEPEDRSGDDEELRALLAAAGPRPAVPPAELAAIRTAARAEWERSRQRRPRRVWGTGGVWRPLPVLLAASLLLALALGWRWWPRTPSEESVATVTASWGKSRRVPVPRADSAALRAGEALAIGTRLTTDAGAAGGRLALQLASGHAVRLDTGTAIRLVSHSRIALEAGAVYVDSGPAGSGGAGVEIATALGTVREMGTQFEVRIDAGEGAGLAIRVREGSVTLALPAGPQGVAAGERLAVTGDGTLARGRVAGDDAAWGWVLEAAPTPAIEGRSLRWVLDWACRENGWHLRFADPALANEAAAILLHGTLEGLRPDESVAVVLAGAGLAHRVEGGALLVDRRPARTRD